MVRTDSKGILSLYRYSTGVILEIEGSIHQRYIRALFHCKKSIKHASDLSNPYVHSIFSLHLTKQIFEKNHGQLHLEAEQNFGLELTLINKVTSKELQQQEPVAASMEKSQNGYW